MSIKFTTVPSKRLAASITASSSTLKLNNIKGWDGGDLSASDFGTELYAILRNAANTLMEIIEIDPSTIADSSVTIDARGLKFDGTLDTEVTANKLSWVKNETIVEIGTNVPQLLEHAVRTTGAQTIAGKKTFSTTPDTTGGNPVADNDLARKAYVDSVVAGSFPASRIVVPGTAGETVADGDPLYFDTTDDEWKLTDADAASTSENVLLGVAQGAGTNGNAITGGVLLLGVDNAQSGLNTGDVMYLSDTAGEISTSPGTKSVVVGIAKSATELYFSPRFALFLTKDQQDAAGGSEGTPSTSNKFTTETAVQKGVHVYAADGEASDTYVITLDPVPAAYTVGMIIHFKANTANSGAATLNVNSLGEKAIKKLNDQDLSTGDIEAGQIVTLVYDGADFQMQSQIALDPTLNLVGVGSGTASFYNFVIPWIDPADTVTNMWTDGATLVTTYKYFDMVGAVGSGSVFMVLYPYSAPNFVKDMIIELEAAIGTNGTPTSNGTEGVGFGVAADGANLNNLLAKDTPVASDGLGFYFDNGDGKFYARTVNNGTKTDTEITGITIANSNVYRIEFVAGASAKFYVNGTLEATITTNLPDGGTTNFGIGCQNTTDTYFVSKMTAPRVSLEI